MVPVFEKLAVRWPPHCCQTVHNEKQSTQAAVAAAAAAAAAAEATAPHSQAQWDTSVITAPGKLGQENWEFEATLGYRMSSRLAWVTQ